MIREPNAARELGEHRDVGVALVDLLEAVLGRIEEETARQLLVARAGVEEGGRAGQVLQRREQAIELQRFRDRLRQGAGDAQKELLRRLNDQSRLRVLQKVAVIDRAQTEVLELPIALRQQ